MMKHDSEWRSCRDSCAARVTCSQPTLPRSTSFGDRIVAAGGLAWGAACGVGGAYRFAGPGAPPSADRPNQRTPRARARIRGGG